MRRSKWVRLRSSKVPAGSTCVYGVGMPVKPSAVVLDGAPGERAVTAADALGDDVLTSWCAEDVVAALQDPAWRVREMCAKAPLAGRSLRQPTPA